MITPCIVVSWLKKLRLPELQPRLEELRADAQRQDAADEEHRHAEPQVHRADVFVVGREQPAAPPMGMVVRVVVVAGVACSGIRDDGAHRCSWNCMVFAASL